MSIFNGILIALSIVGCIGHEEPRSSRTPETPSRHFRQFEESRENRGYVEQCRATNLWKGQLAHANVVAFLDPSWYYSYRQAIMLKLLKKRLDKSGFTNILFFAVTPSLSLPEDNAENSIEIKTWREISKNIWKSEYFFDLEETMFDDSTRDKNDVIFLQDNPELNVWENFRALKDEVVVLDRCGRLTYQVIVPWSILYFPYVKAAILSTYKDDPCGPCEVHPSLERDSMDYEEYLLKHTNLNENLNSYRKKIENEQSTYPSTIPDTTVKTTDTETHKYSELNSTKQFDRNTENATTPEIDGEQIQLSSTIPDSGTTENYEETSEQILLNKQTDTNNNNSYSTINVTSEDTQKEETEGLPLRIILYAPHLHEESQTIKKYTHLVLKTGSPDYHDHFNVKSTVSNEELVVSPKSNATMLGIQKLAEYVDGINESPGLYGEISDYWRTQNDEDVNDKNGNTEFPDYDDAMVDDTETNIDDALVSESRIVRPTDRDPIDADTNIDNNDDANNFAQQRLIEHYNKLLTWIYYII